MNFESFEDAVNFWREIFPKITTEQIQDFESKYRGSDEERKDLIKNYNRFEGDLDKVLQYQMFYDEDNVQEILKELIDDEEIEAFDAFVNEKQSKRSKRIKKKKKEQAAFEKESNKKKKKGKKDENGDADADDDLVAAILANRGRQHSNLISSLEAKYGNKGKNKKARHG